MYIAITGGGTGGHLSIAKALGQECRNKGIKTLYIGGTRGQDKQWFESDKQTFDSMLFLESMPVVNQNTFGKCKALLQNIKESFKAKSEMKKCGAKACISVGGFSAATGSFGAIFCGIPLFIHEQNACMGSLNKLLKPFAKKFFSSFEFPDASITPYPVNKEFFEKQRIRTQVEVIAFIGGSQGAKAINEFALKIAPNLKNKNIRILHQAGKNEYKNIKQDYIEMGFCIADSLDDIKQNKADVFVFDFSKQMVDIMQMSDFCISRSGASSLWESVSNGLPSLFIPYPYAAKNHQHFNAKCLSDKNMALLYNQEEITKIMQDTTKINTLLDTILDIELDKLSTKLLQESKQNGASIIIDEILNYTQNK